MTAHYAFGSFESKRVLNDCVFLFYLYMSVYTSVALEG